VKWIYFLQKTIIIDETKMMELGDIIAIAVGGFVGILLIIFFVCLMRKVS